jgi:uncharacterized protein YecT (DUF1311 family)
MPCGRGRQRLQFSSQQAGDGQMTERYEAAPKVERVSDTNSTLNLLELNMQQVNQKTDKCVQDAYKSYDSTGAELVCRKQSMKDWDKALNANYSFLMENIPNGEFKTATRDAQRQWIVARDEQFKAIDLKWKSKSIQEGSIVENPSTNALAEKSEIIRKQAEWLHALATDALYKF